jgi:hypothetical protein
VEGAAGSLSHPMRHVSRNPWFGRRDLALTRSTDGTFDHATGMIPFVDEFSSRGQGMGRGEGVSSSVETVDEPDLLRAVLNSEHCDDAHRGPPARF